MFCCTRTTSNAVISTAAEQLWRYSGRGVPKQNTHQDAHFIFGKRRSGQSPATHTPNTQNSMKTGCAGSGVYRHQLQQVRNLQPVKHTGRVQLHEWLQPQLQIMSEILFSAETHVNTWWYKQHLGAAKYIFCFHWSFRVYNRCFVQGISRKTQG